MEQVASRITDSGTTLVLKRRQSNRFNGPYEYYVTEQGSSNRIDQLEPTKKDGMEQLRESVRAYESDSSRDDLGFGGGMLGLDDGIGGGFGMAGSGPTLPEFGMEEEDGTEDQFPFRF